MWKSVLFAIERFMSMRESNSGKSVLFAFSVGFAFLLLLPPAASASSSAAVASSNGAISLQKLMASSGTNHIG